MEYKELTICRACGSDKLRQYLDLGDVPLCNSLVTSHQQDIKKYPIQMYYCDDCSLSQLGVIVDPKILYKDYVYHSSISNTFKKHCYELALKLKEMFAVSDKPEWFTSTEEKWKGKVVPRIMDIASNDGCLLREFKKAGFSGLGIEPSSNLLPNLDLNTMTEEDIDKLNITEWVPTINAFWSEETAESLDYGRIRPWGKDGDGHRMDFITAQNVFGHVHDLNDFLRGVRFALQPDGVFVIEVPHLLNLINNNEFDTIYHEHLSYFLVKPLIKLFEDNKLPIFRVEQVPIHGGSIRIYASHGHFPKESSVDEVLELERSNGMYEFETYNKFADRVAVLQNQVNMFLEVLWRSGKKLMAYGASAKGISLLNYCNIPAKYIHSIVDDTPDKQGKYTPGSTIPIVNHSHFEIEEPAFILLLAWNFAKELIDKTPGHRTDGGYYLVPIPEFKVV